MTPPPPPPRINEDTRCITDCQLVIAQCDESLDWLKTRARLYERVFVYAKCAFGGRLERTRRAVAGMSNVEVIPSPNVGSNDYAVLQHTIRHYYELAPLTVFCEAGQYWLCHPDTVVRPKLKDRRTTTRSPYLRLTQFRSGPSDSWPFSAKNSGPYGPHYAGTFTCSHWGNYVYGQASKEKGRDQKQGDFKQSFALTNFSSLEAWLRDTAGDQLAEYLLQHAGHLTLGGYFAAEAANLRRYPIELYKAFAAQQLHPNEEVDHFIERMWGLLLTTPHAMSWRRSLQLFEHIFTRAREAGRTDGTELVKLKPAWRPFVPASVIVKRKGYKREG